MRPRARLARVIVAVALAGSAGASACACASSVDVGSHGLPAGADAAPLAQGESPRDASPILDAPPSADADGGPLLDAAPAYLKASNTREASRFGIVALDG